MRRAKRQVRSGSEPWKGIAYQPDQGLGGRSIELDRLGDLVGEGSFGRAVGVELQQADAIQLEDAPAARHRLVQRRPFSGYLFETANESHHVPVHRRWDLDTTRWLQPVSSRF